VEGGNAAGSPSAPAQVGGHCKNVPTLEYGFLVQVRVLRPRSAPSAAWSTRARRGGLSPTVLARRS